MTSIKCAIEHWTTTSFSILYKENGCVISSMNSLWTGGITQSEMAQGIQSHPLPLPKVWTQGNKSPICNGWLSFQWSETVGETSLNWRGKTHSFVHGIEIDKRPLMAVCLCIVSSRASSLTCIYLTPHQIPHTHYTPISHRN